MQLLRTGLFDARRLHRPARRRPPRGQPRHRPRGRRRRLHGGARSPRTPSSTRPTRAMAIATQFGFEAGPVIAWADRLRAAGITLPVHIGVAGPAKLQTMLKFAMACGVGPSLARAAAPRRRPRQADAAVRADRVPRRARRAQGGAPRLRGRARALLPARRHRRDHRLRRRRRRARPAARGHEPDRRCSSTSTAPSSTPTTCTTPPSSAILAERGRALTLDEYRTHIMGHPNEAILDRYFPGEDMAILDRKEAMFRDEPRRQRRAGRRHPRACSTGPRRPAPAAPSSPTPRATTPSPCSPPRASPTGCRPWSSATNARARSPTPSPTGPRCARSASRPSRSVAFEDSRSGIRAARDCRRLRLRHDHRPRARRARRRRRPRGDRRLHRPRPLGASRPSSRPASHDPHHRRIEDEDRHHRLRPAVLRDRRAHQPDGPQAARRRARGRQLRHRREGRARAGRLRRHHARCQRRRRLQLEPEPERDRAAVDAADDRARARPRRRSAFDRQLASPARSRPASRPRTAARCSTPSPARRSGSSASCRW